MRGELKIVPIFQKDANRFVVDNHRHHGRVTGSIFQVGLSLNETLVGVAICGRPVTNSIDHKRVIELNRLCIIEEVENGCSKLYATCARISKEMGYEKIITYTLMSEPGISLKASGWIIEAENVGGTWTGRKRLRINQDLFGNKKYPEEPKRRWAKILNT